MGAAAVVLAALVAMAALTALALAEADRLLDRLGRSQDQLARVESIEADVNAWLLGALEGADPAIQRRAMDDLGREIEAYLATIAAERNLMRDPAALALQAEELARGEELAGLVAALRADAVDEGRRSRLRQLAQSIGEGERAEAEAAIALMRRLKTRTVGASVAIFTLVALSSLAGAIAMTRSVARPLRRLEAAAGRVGRGEAAPDPVRLDGFAELQHVASAFNRLEAEVEAQRRALARHNESLEAQVAARTAELEASNAQLAEVDRTRRLFFSKVSHELRTPATVIRSEAEVALRDPDASAEDLREALGHVAANSAFLQRRLDDLLALARAEDGQIRLRRERVALGPLLERVVELAEPYTRSAGMALIGEGLDRPDLAVEGDASWLGQALLAVVDNAAKHARGSRGLRLTLAADAQAATIALADGGPGAPLETIPHLFDSFYQGPNGAAAGGAGVGLSVTRWVAEQHGGTVSARNEEGRGLLVELRLPIAP